MAPPEASKHWSERKEEKCGLWETSERRLAVRRGSREQDPGAVEESGDTGIARGPSDVADVPLAVLVEECGALG